MNREEIETHVAEEIDKRSAVCAGRFVSRAGLTAGLIALGTLIAGVAISAVGYATDQTARTSALEVQVIGLQENVDQLQEIHEQTTRIEAMLAEMMQIRGE